MRPARSSRSSLRSPSAPSRRRPDAMDTTAADGPRRRLDALRAETVERERSLVRTFDGIVEATSDVATDDEHDPEGHTIAWERQQVAGLLEETTSALAEIDAAERRLDDGSYGVCASCGGQ